MNICVIGTGYVGLVTGTCLADTGNTVWCVDSDTAKIKDIQAGIMPIYEPGLEELVVRNTREGRLHFTADIKTGMAKALFCFIAVGTPSGSDGAADLSQVVLAAQSVGRHMEHYTVVVNKSTVPVGTGEKVRDIIDKELASRSRGDIDFEVVSNPEFLKEGAAIDDFMRPDRVIIGTESDRAAYLMKQLFTPFVHNGNPILIMNVKSAEIAKYAANAMLATRISFMNEIAKLCDKAGGDIADIRKGIGTDPRIGMQFLYAGIGYGGSCFPKDVRELMSTGLRYGISMEIVSAVEQVNERQKEYLVKMIKARFGSNLAGKKFALWGLAFKPQTDDMREAPSIVVIEALLRMGASIMAYDPQAVKYATKIFTAFSDGICYAGNMMDALNEADALILVTEWGQFRQPDFGEMRCRLKCPIIFDGRNQYDPHQMTAEGFEYYCVGRGCCVK